MMGGNIEVQSDINKGETIIINFRVLCQPFIDLNNNFCESLHNLDNSHNQINQQINQNVDFINQVKNIVVSQAH